MKICDYIYARDNAIAEARHVVVMNDGEQIWHLSEEGMTALLETLNNPKKTGTGGKRKK